MFEVRKYPFERDEDPARHMVDLLSRQAEKDGVPLTDAEKEILLAAHSKGRPIPEDLRTRFLQLIERQLRQEREDGTHADPRSFDGSLEWAGDWGYPNIVQLADEVMCEFPPDLALPLTGWKLFKDRLQLVGCGCAVVLCMFLIGAIMSVWFAGK